MMLRKNKRKKMKIIGILLEIEILLGTSHLRRFNRQQRFLRLRCQTPIGVREMSLVYFLPGLKIALPSNRCTKHS